MSIYDAAMLYQKHGVPLIVLAGKEYGSGSSRDWAAKGTMLLGVKAVIAESFERIHRSNLVNMGVLPLEFTAGESVATLGLTGREVFDLIGSGAALRARCDVIVRAMRRGRVGHDVHGDVAHRHAGGADGVLARRHPAVRAAAARQEIDLPGVTDPPWCRRTRFAITPSSSGSISVASRRRPPSRNLTRLREWLDRGYAGEMIYLHKSADTRADIRNFLPSARSVIVTGTVYYTANADASRSAPDAAQIARYAWGEDYHVVLAERLEALVAWMREQRDEPFDAAIFVDKHHVQERVFAKHAGLGWIGKNTCLINPELGSWLFLAGVAVSLDLAADTPRAGSVRRVHALPRRVSDRRAGRAVRAGRDALHLVPHHRAAAARFPSTSAQASAITSSGVTSARTCVPRTSRRSARSIRRGSRAPAGRRRERLSCGSARISSCTRSSTGAR